MDRLHPHYQKVAKEAGYKIKLFTGTENTIAGRLGSIDLMVIFTNKVSHNARKLALEAARADNIPVMMCHSCGVSTLKDCLKSPSSECPIRK
ncbi:DUF2325 domain-containing protein [Desulfurispira natronophila]|uniref:DUF2325 domain-containing protein n=1 Tax=Desulfurispira natronophila TaxID=682562 RepID=UPI0031B623F2